MAGAPTSKADALHHIESETLQLERSGPFFSNNSQNIQIVISIFAESEERTQPLSPGGTIDKHEIEKIP